MPIEYESFSQFPEVSAISGTSKLVGLDGGANVQFPASLFEAPVNFVKATLTSAQILDLYANPVEILPAQGANKLIIASTIFINYFFGTTAYITNTSLSLVGSGVQAYTMTSALGQGTDYALQYIITGNGGNSAGLAAFTNLPLELTTLVGNPANGDGTLDIYVTYQIITL